MKIIRGHRRNPGNGAPLPREELISDIKFHQYKFNNRTKPTKDRILIITCFSEFGCESIALHYCIPRILQQYPGAYVICVGWFGREYLYRHLVDEYWELDENHQWLREFAQAFKNKSRNILKLEQKLKEYGQVYKGINMGHILFQNICFSCKHVWYDDKRLKFCPKCNHERVSVSLFSAPASWRKYAVKIPKPKEEIKNIANKYLKPNSVGIFARGRACYGRNLSPDFYIKLINRLEEKGYNPIWLGEKQSVIPCPKDHILDFSRLPESRNLELTLAIISQLKFTVQFWTASTRFASMMDVPWILFESEDQIYGTGQEGKRIALSTAFDKKKIVLSQYHEVVENEDIAIDLVDQAINEINLGNWNDIIGLVNNPEVVKIQMQTNNIW